MTQEMAPIGLLVRTVLESIFQVVLICLAGYLLARGGTLDKRTQKQVNRINVAFFTPALLFSKVAFFLTPAKLEHLWIVPVFFVLASGLSMLVAYLLGLLFCLKRSQRNFAAAAAMFMNSTSLPVALVQSLVGTVKGLKRSPDDDENAMISRGLTFIMLFSCLGMILRWSVGVHLLAPKNGEEDEDERDQSSTGRSEFERGRSHQSREGILVDVTPPSPSSQNEIEVPERQKKFHHIPVFFYVPRTPERSPTPIPSTHGTPPLQGQASSDGDDEAYSYQETTLLLPRSIPRVGMTPSAKGFFDKQYHRLKKFLKSINEVMSPPLWASVLSLIVAMIPPLQSVLKTKLDFIKNAADTAGACAVPLTLAILGAYFHHDEDVSSKERQENATNMDDEDRHGSGKSGLRHTADGFRQFLDKVQGAWKEKSPPGETMTVAIAVLTRMLLVPFALIPLMALGAHYDTPKVFEDPMLMVTLVILISSPPALMLVQITQQVSGDKYDSLMSRTVFWSYCIVAPPATVAYVVIGLLLTKI